jgi:hypothetical protein
VLSAHPVMLNNFSAAAQAREEVVVWKRKVSIARRTSLKENICLPEDNFENDIEFRSVTETLKQLWRELRRVRPDSFDLKDSDSQGPSKMLNMGKSKSL